MLNIKNPISIKRTIQLSLSILGLLSLFHLSVIVGIIFFDYSPIEFLWGGRMETAEELLRFEIISFVVMLVCLFIVLVKAGRIYLPRLSGFITIALWILFILFLLNTIGNILAETTFEKLFAIITIILAILCLRLAIDRNQTYNNEL